MQICWLENGNGIGTIEISGTMFTIREVTEYDPQLDHMFRKIRMTSSDMVLDGASAEVVIPKGKTLTKSLVKVNLPALVSSAVVKHLCLTLDVPNNTIEGCIHNMLKKLGISWAISDEWTKSWIEYAA